MKRGGEGGAGGKIGRVVRETQREVKRGRDKAREIEATRRERQRAREVKQYYRIGK